MPYDTALADRVRAILAGRGPADEMAMFGGLAFMVNGAMAVGVIGNDLIVRQDPAQTEAILAEPGLRPMDFTGKPMKGWFYAGPAAVGDDARLRAWIDRSATYTASLPPRKPRPMKPRLPAPKKRAR